MKNLLIAFLLAIFSVQGTVAAVGGDIAVPLQGQEKSASLTGLWSGAVDDAEGLKVSPTLEELSDYVVFALPASKGRYQTTVPASPPVFLPSTDLPRIKPPPRN
jgi:hypothetical protein